MKFDLARSSELGARRSQTSDLRLQTFRMLLLGSVLVLSGCDWFIDFKRQPSVWTWEPIGDSLTVRGAPQGSVPASGTAMAGFQVSYTPGIAQVESLAVIPNPVPVSDSSLANGRKYYQLNCAVCHGDRAMGDGPATRFGMVPINLTIDIAKNRSDGYIWGMIRNGRGLMPTYNRIEERARWDVVNYLRGLQGLIAGRTIEVGPVAPPGVTGAALPGATQLGPQTWIRPMLPSMKLTPRSGQADHAPPAPRDTTRHEDTGGDR
ncbi:MAG TPA: cytochrome c [Gemmatimonadaceae bacterium]|nr:cytochrome c [Gemmatimonadaceae bacterium]